MEKVHPKEKARLAAQRRRMTSLYGEARKEYLHHIGQLEQHREKRCRSAVAKGSILINLSNRTYEYFPSTGEVLWAASALAMHKVGSSALALHKNGYAILYDANSNAVPATRMIHEAVHGPIEEGHEVYCVNGDNKDLRIRNLRSHHDGGRGATAKATRAYNKLLKELPL